MTRRAPHSSALRSPWLVAGAAASLLLGVAGLATTAQAQPAPSAAPRADGIPASYKEPVAPPAASSNSTARVRLAESFLADLDRSGAVIVGLGDARVRAGGTLEFPVEATLGDGFALGGGFAITVNGQPTFSCPNLTVSFEADAVYCTQDGVARRVLDLGAPEKTTSDGRVITRSNMPLSIASERRAGQMNSGLKREPLAAGDVIGEMDLTTKRLLRGWDGDVDDRTGCWIGYYAGDTSIWRGWAIQALVNRLPKDVGMSRYSYDATTKKGTLVDGNAPGVAVGQRTPYMEKITTGVSKKIVRGSYYASDNFWDGPNYGCNTNPPFVVGQGLVNDPNVRAWRYDGGLRNKTNNPAGAARPQWWGHARQTDYDGPTGNYSWTCRGVPENRTSTAAQPNGDSRWDMVTQGSGFFGDNATDREDPNAGRAPACRDLNLDNFNLTTRYSISKRGGLEARNDQGTYPRSCSVDGNPLVECWQEIYPLWDRAWAFQSHVYASAMRASLTSNATINIPASWSPTGVAMLKPIAWRITDGDITGAWPQYVDGQGATVDFSGIKEKFSSQDMTQVSPFTVPGTNAPFTVGGYGTPMGAQEMSFILTADTDGSWTWPVDKNGRELPRPQIKMTFNYVISNFDDGGSCTAKIWYDDAGFGIGRNNDTAGAHCLEGKVPTIWPLPEDKSNMWKRVYDDFITDKDGKKVRNTPTVTFESKPLTSCLQDKELTVQDNSTKNVPAVGADFTWDIRISGQVKSFSGC